jgi:hypothetical protein
MTETSSRGNGPDDEELLAQLRDLFQHADRVPTEVIAAAKDLYGLRTLDADLAELTWDSLLDEPPVAVRSAMGTAAPRLLTFDADELSVEIEVLDDGPHRALTGQLVPPQRAGIEVRQLTASAGTGASRLVTTSVDADELGRFAVDGLAPGPVALTCHRPGSRTVTTDWIRLA